MYLPLGTIATSDGAFSYTLTPSDLLWVGRSAACEAAGKRAGIEAVLWTYASRLVAAHTAPTRAAAPGAFGDLVLAHSQPINPAWRADGDACRPGGSFRNHPPGASNWYGQFYVSTGGVKIYPCDPARLEKRRKCSTTPWEQLSPVVRDSVVMFASGKAPNPVPRSVDFASGLSLSSGMQLVAELGGNDFQSSPESRAWPSNYVRITGPDGSTASDGGGGGSVALLAVAAVGTLAYRLWKAWS